MAYELFPPEYIAKRKAEYESILKREDEKLQDVRDRMYYAPSRNIKLEALEIFVLGGGISILAWMAGGFLVFVLGSMSHFVARYFWEIIGTGFWLIPLVSYAVVIYSYLSRNKKQKTVGDAWAAKYASQQAEHDRVCKEAEEKYKADCDSYSKAFKSEANKKEKELLDSAIPPQVADILLPYLCQVIEKQDRSKHLEFIDFTYRLELHSNHIGFVHDKKAMEISFERNRWGNIEDAATTVALARIIFKHIRLKLAAARDTDPSGTMFMTEAKYSSRGHVFHIDIHYKAPNGFFEAKKSW